MYKMSNADKERELTVAIWQVSNPTTWRWEAKLIFSDGSYIIGVDPDAMIAIHSAIRIFYQMIDPEEVTASYHD